MFEIRLQHNLPFVWFIRMPVYMYVHFVFVLFKQFVVERVLCQIFISFVNMMMII